MSRATVQNAALVSPVTSKQRLSKYPVFNGAPFVIPVGTHNLTRKVDRVFLLQLQCQGLWVSTHLLHALDKSPHTSLLPVCTNREEKGIEELEFLHRGKPSKFKAQLLFS